MFDIFSSLRFVAPAQHSVPSKGRVMWNAFLLVLLSSLILVIVMEIENAFDKHWLEEILDTVFYREQFMETTFLIVVIIIGPVIEEVAFRGFVTKNRILAVLSMTGIITLCSFTLVAYLPVRISEDAQVFSGIAAMSAVGALLYFLNKHREELINFIEMHHYKLIHCSMLAFALMHIPNHDISNASLPGLLHLPFVLLQYYAYAIAFTYIRIKNGLYWSIGAHMFVNGVASLLAYAELNSSI